jgi:hypothetical protein
MMTYMDLNGTCNNNPAAAGTFQPLEPLAALLGEEVGGDWTITAQDLAGGDGGNVDVTLNLSFSQEIAFPVPAGSVVQSVGNNTYVVTGFDQCGPVTISYADSYNDSDCGLGEITRTWIATDASGNQAESCTETIFVEPISAADLRLPPALIELPCESGTDPEDIAAFFDNPLTRDIPLGPTCDLDVVERNEGYPFAYPTYDVVGCDGNLHPQKVDNNVCNLYATYSDQVIPACGPGCHGNVKVIRSWDILDWCTTEVTPYVQLIKAVDQEGPTFGLMDVTVSTDPWSCTANVEIPEPWELHDNCDYEVEYTVSGPAGVVIVGDQESGYIALGAPKGVHTFTYTASDCCGNTTSQDATVTVFDGTAPVVVTKQNIVISLTSSSTNTEGVAKLFAESVDNGSYDNCTGIKLEVRRDEDPFCDAPGNTTYNDDQNAHPQDGSPNPNASNYDPDGGAYVKFCCDDITNEAVDVNGDGELDAGYVKVWLRVWDDGNMNGVAGDALGGDNYNESWVYVKVEDKLTPAIVCPPDIELTCDMDYTNTEVTGEASAFASCGALGTEYNDIIVNLNTCNEGFVRRRWSIPGTNPAITCDQTITLIDIDAPVNVSFSGVSDRDFVGCPDGGDFGEPSWTAGPCDVLGYTVETDTFRFEDGACYKLVNHWTVINWCDYEPNNPQRDGEGLWEHTQVIKITDETVPVIEDCEDKMFAINDHGDSDNDGNVCEAKITLTNSATDPGSANCPTGWLKWQVFVDLWGDGTNDLEYSSFLPPFDSQFNDTNGNGIPDVYVAPTENGGTISISLPDIEGSMSNHKVFWKVTDGCGNVDDCGYDFMVVDKKAPTPYCVSLSTAVMEMGENNEPGVDLWAIDFNVGSFDNCSKEEKLRYTFTSTPPQDDPLYDEASRSSSRTFGCADVANSPVSVSMYVWDEKDNADFCQVLLTVVDNQGLCDPDGSRPVSGTTATEDSEGVEGVEVTINSIVQEFPRTEVTDGSGSYAFDFIPVGGDYSISGTKGGDYLNGVSTLDLVKIQQHILGISSLDSPYKVIAADINNDEKISASDLLSLRKLILGITTSLDNNASWRMVDATQEFADAMNPWPVDERIDLTNLQEAVENGDFVAVKVGDVSGNATANVMSVASESRSGKTLNLVTEDQEVEQGETVELVFSSENFEEVYGYQMTMELNGLSYAGVTSGSVEMTENNVGVLSNNIVTVSYSNSSSTTLTSSEAVFTMSFVANRSGKVSEMLGLSSRVTAAEAYMGSSLAVSEVVLEVRGGTVSEGISFELSQNEPNPFRDQTVVNFTLPEAGQATLTVFDVTGKVLNVTKVDGVKGMNSVVYTKDDFGTSGVMYYQLESGDYTATKKMILIE